MSGVSMYDNAKNESWNDSMQKSKFELLLHVVNFLQLSSIYGGRMRREVSLLLLEGFLVMEKFSQLFGDPFIKMSVPFGTSPLPEMKPLTVIVCG